MPFKKTLQWEHILQVNFVTQEEDSEEEPKLKYERLSNGVTEILQNDAASCMTVHDKVEVIIQHPQGHFSLSPPISAPDFTLFMSHLRDVLFKVGFYLPCSPVKAAHSFRTFCCFCSQGGTSKDTRHHCLPLFIPTLAYSCPPPLSWLSNVGIFKRGPLSASWLIAVAPAAHMHAWAEQKSRPVMSPHLMFY